MDRPTLRGELVLLRPLDPSDIEEYTELLSDAESRRLTGTHADFTHEQLLSWLGSVGQRDDRVDMAIVPHAHGRLVGEVVLNQIDADNRCASLRIAIGGAHVGHGYGSEAIALMLAHAFDTLRLHRVELSVYDFNPRAQHVYEKLGFRREGLRRDTLLWEGAYHSSIEMAILEGEHRARRDGR